MFKRHLVKDLINDSVSTRLLAQGAGPNRNKAETHLRLLANKKKQAKRGILEPRTLIENFHMIFGQMY